MFDDLDDIIKERNIDDVKKDIDTSQSNSYNRNNGNNQFKRKKEWLADKNHTPKKVDPELLKRHTKCFTVRGEDVPSSRHDMYRELATKLDKLNFTLRVNKDDKNTLEQLFIPNMSPDHIHTYLPWKNYAKIQNAHHDTPSEDAYRIATDIHKIYNDLKPGLRAVIARDVHIVLGDDLQSPVDFIIVDTPDGAEKTRECTKETGRASFLIRLADKANIPVFNFNNDSSIKAFKLFLTDLLNQ